LTELLHSHFLNHFGKFFFGDRIVGLCLLKVFLESCNGRLDDRKEENELAEGDGIRVIGVDILSKNFAFMVLHVFFCIPIQNLIVEWDNCLEEISDAHLKFAFLTFLVGKDFKGLFRGTVESDFVLVVPADLLCS